MLNFFNYFLGVCIELLSTSTNASFNTSEIVGWANIISAASSAGTSNAFNIAASFTSSVAFLPIIWTPSISPYFSSAITFINPADALSVKAFPFAAKLNLPTFIL